MLTGSILPDLLFFDKEISVHAETLGGLPENVIVAPTEPIYRAVRQAGRCTERDRRLDLFRICLLPGSRTAAAVAGPALGAPAAALLVERLVREQVKRVVLLGVCGALVPELQIGDGLIPTGGISEEGTSPLYCVGDIPAPDPTLLERIRRASRQTGWIPQEGTIWTTDAPYRESAEKRRHFRGAGAVAVDMEFTALATVSRVHRLSFAAFMVVSDERFSEPPRIGFATPRFRKALQRAATVVIHLFS